MSAVEEHIAAAVAAHGYPGDLVGRFLLVAEVIDAETGERATVSVVPDDAMPWDTMGLASFVLAREQAGVARAEDD